MKAPQNNGWSVKQVLRMVENGGIRFDYPIQRPSGVWKSLQKSYLIHSLTGEFPIPPIYHLLIKEIVDDKEMKIRYVLDGKQRLTTIKSFVDGEYELDEATPSVEIEGVEYDLAGLAYDELPEEVQDMILSRTILNYSFDSEEITDEEIEDLFFRMNSGTALSEQQKAKGKMGVKWATRLNELGEHIFFKELAAFSPTQIKSDAHITAILQTMMMMDNFNYKNVSQRVIAAYQMTFKEDEENKLVLFKKVEAAINYLMEVFSKKDTLLLKKVHLPMILLTALEAIDQNVEPDVFSHWVIAFKEAFKASESITDIPTTYKEFTGKGTTDKVKADGRMNEMKRHFNEYLTIYNNQKK